MKFKSIALALILTAATSFAPDRRPECSSEKDALILNIQTLDRPNCVGCNQTSLMIFGKTKQRRIKSCRTEKLVLMNGTLNNEDKPKTDGLKTLDKKRGIYEKNIANITLIRFISSQGF